jgi:hypothetical protein
MADVYTAVREGRHLFMQRRAEALLESDGFVRGLFSAALSEAAGELALLYGTAPIDEETQRTTLSAALDENLPYFQAAFDKKWSEQV